MPRHPAFSYARKKFAEKYPRESAIVKNEMMSFRLAFWDENMERSFYPYLAQIQLVDHKLYYYYADPKTQALLDPIVEPLP